MTTSGFHYIYYQNIVKIHDEACLLFENGFYVDSYQKALEGIERCEKCTNFSKDLNEKVKILEAGLLHTLATSLSHLSNFDHSEFKKVKSLLLKAIKILDIYKDDYLQAIVYYSLTWVIISQITEKIDYYTDSEIELLKKETLNFIQFSETLILKSHDSNLQIQVLKQHLNICNELFPYDDEKAYDCIEVCQRLSEIYNHKNMLDEANDMLILIGFSYLKLFKGKSTNLKLARSFLKKALVYAKDHMPKSEVSHIEALIALSFMLDYKNPHTNLRKAQSKFDQVLLDRVEAKNEMDLFFMQQWCITVHALPYDHTKIDLAIARLESILEESKNTNNLDNWLMALKILESINKQNYSNKYSRDYFIESANDFIEFIDEEKEPELWAEAHYLIINNTHNLNSKKSITECLEIYHHLLENEEAKKDPHINFKINSGIASLYADMQNWQLADEFYQRAISSLIDFEKGDTTKEKIGSHYLPSDESLLRPAPIAAIHCGAIDRALFYHDILNIRISDQHMEDLLYIDNNPDRERLFTQYVVSQQFLQFSEMFESDEEYDSHIETINTFKEELKKIKTQSKGETKLQFFSNLNQYLVEQSDWIFIPMLDDKTSIFLLIPPHSSIDGIHIHQTYTVNYLSEMSILQKIEDIWNSGHGDNEAEKTASTSRAEQALSFMQAHLWDNYIEWVYEKISEVTPSNNPKLCIIINGPLMALPFSSVKNPETNQYLTDTISITHAPSLYANFCLSRRNDFSDDISSLGFVSGNSIDKTNNDHLDFIELEYLLSQKSFGSDHSRQTSLDNIKETTNMLFESTHWHIASHANFDWGDPTQSYVGRDDSKFHTDHFKLFRPKSQLRLVVLSGCFTGSQDMMTKNTDPFSMIGEFMSMVLPTMQK